MEQQLNTLNKPMVTLVKRSLPFKLVIPKEVQRKIDLMCTRINHIEWSGSLFYNVEGSWKGGDLVIRLVDFYLQDIGNAGSTTFEQTPDLAGYRVDHDLLTEQMGLIHSHHNMAAFFSGTDMNTLKEEAMDHNHFVSLVVNNKRQYVAGITSVNTVKRKMQVTEEKEFTTFNGVKETGVPETYEKEDLIHTIEWSDLAIEIEDYEESNQELLDRIIEIQKIKAARPVVSNATSWQNPNYQSYNQYPPKTVPFQNPFQQVSKAPFENPQQATLPFDPEEESEFFTGVEKLGESKVDLTMLPTIPKDIIDHKVKQLITLSRVVPKEGKLKLDKFVDNMPKRFPDLFQDLHHFQSFISFYVEDIIVDPLIINDPTIQQYSEEDITTAISLDVIEQLEDLIPMIKNVWFEAIYDEVLAYTK